MKVDENKLREMVKQVMSDRDESDLITRKDDGRTWEEMSNELKLEVDKMIDNISKDKYTTALDNISEISATMKMWKHRIVTGGKVRIGGGEKHDLGRFNLENNPNTNK